MLSFPNNTATNESSARYIWRILRLQYLPKGHRDSSHRNLGLIQRYRRVKIEVRPARHPKLKPRLGSSDRSIRAPSMHWTRMNHFRISDSDITIRINQKSEAREIARIRIIRRPRVHESALFESSNYPEIFDRIQCMAPTHGGRIECH